MRPFLRRLALPFLVATLAACGSKEPSASDAEQPAAVAIYRKVRCDTCHGPNGDGLPRVGPPLRDIARNWTQAELVEYLRDPAPFRESKAHLKALASGFFAHMRAFPELGPDDRAVLAAWLLER